MLRPFNYATLQVVFHKYNAKKVSEYFMNHLMKRFLSEDTKSDKIKWLPFGFTQLLTFL